MRFILSLALVLACSVPAFAQYGVVVRQRAFSPAFAAGCGIGGYGVQAAQFGVYQQPVFAQQAIYAQPVFAAQAVYAQPVFAQQFGYGIGGGFSRQLNINVGRNFGFGGVRNFGIGGGFGGPTVIRQRTVIR